MTELAANGKPRESVWDFPRPPRLEWVDWRVRVVHHGTRMVDAPGAWRVIETSQAPAYYVASTHVSISHLRSSGHRTLCEWKGLASYADVVSAESVVPAAAWTYAEPTAPFAQLLDHWAFYAQRVDECWIDDERIEPNEGNFYGGWITANVEGPFKGAPGTAMW